jgi:glutamine synthetase
MDFNLTPEEQRAIAEATPEEWAEAIDTLSRDPDFWKDLGKAAIEGFFDGITRALNER